MKTFCLSCNLLKEIQENKIFCKECKEKLKREKIKNEYN
jgi:hypothetical protein